MTAAATRLARVGLWAIVGAFALLGLITGGLAVLEIGGIAAGMGGLVASVMAQQKAGEKPSARRRWAAVFCWAGVGALGVAAFAGLEMLLGLAAVPAAVALLGVVLWVRRVQGTAASSPEVPDGDSLAGLSNVELAAAWRTSYLCLATTRDAATLDRISALRRRQLDEIECRDPEGFHRWLSSGIWVSGDSAPFLGG